MTEGALPAVQQHYSTGFRAQYSREAVTVLSNCPDQQDDSETGPLDS
jgi:hypothetical protein